MGLFSVVVDTNVLYAMPVADTLMLATQRDLFTLHWTREIFDELERTFLKMGFSDHQAKARINAMSSTFAETEVTAYQGFISAVQLTDPNDRHVVAAAIRAQAELIVTQNLRHFPLRVLAPFGLRACSADEFLTELAEAYPDQVHQLLVYQARQMKKNPVTYVQLLEKLERRVPKFASLIRQHDAVREATERDTHDAIRDDNVLKFDNKLVRRKPKA